MNAIVGFVKECLYLVSDTNPERTTIMKGAYLIKRISVHEFNAHIMM